MSPPIHPTRSPAVDAEVPAQRTATGRRVPRLSRDAEGRFVVARPPAPAAEATGTAADSITCPELPTGGPEPLPQLAAAMAAVPGGLGIASAETFTFAGQRWTPADAGVDGTPIGMQLAMEQRARAGAAVTELDARRHRKAGG